MAVYTQAEYSTLCKAIAQGVSEVSYGDKKVVYRSLSDMLRAKSLMEAELGIKGSTKKKLLQHSKGLS